MTRAEDDALRYSIQHGNYLKNREYKREYARKYAKEHRDRITAQQRERRRLYKLGAIRKPHIHRLA